MASTITGSSETWADQPLNLATVSRSSRTGLAVGKLYNVNSTIINSTSDFTRTHS
jgi:hypothetical protein